MVAVPVVVPTVAVIVAVPAPVEVNVAVATPPVVVALAAMAPAPVPLTAKVTVVPSATGFPLPSNAATVIADVAPTCMEPGDADVFTVIAGRISRETVWLTEPTVAVIVSSAAVARADETVKVAVATPLTVCVTALSAPREGSLKEKLTVIPLPRTFPCLSRTVAVSVVLSSAAGGIVVASVVFPAPRVTEGAETVTIIVLVIVPEVAVIVTGPSDVPVNVVASVPPVVVPLVALRLPRVESLRLNVTGVPSTTAAPNESVKDAVIVDGP